MAKEQKITEDVLETVSSKFMFIDGELCYKNSPHKSVGWQDKGYLRVKIGGKTFYQHRIVWFLHYGEWPVLEIDHIDGNKSNNLIDNLRLATTQQNFMNKPQHIGKKFSRGVYWSKERQRFRAIFCVDGKNTHLGYYDTEEEARSVYLITAKNLYGEFVYDKT